MKFITIIEEAYGCIDDFHKISVAGHSQHLIEPF
jgi:hypothetical protein